MKRGMGGVLVSADVALVCHIFSAGLKRADRAIVDAYFS
jgi:hypothetical protein